ncbi:hypothetical protein BV898_05787 [Hypsibius exemplaris]|uniref:RNA pseudouridylate synthase domain-containing protein 4 n=1 Tax=Hypsibius exemplaris TaxID=2072580 RepID=A0A1W0WYF5_HYPEX|nr:hypothetical protein BV898_05787 [Hypsibius exemplaris]
MNPSGEGTICRTATRWASTYRHTVPNWDRTLATDVISLLKKSVIYDKDDIVAINKPYGLPVHGGPGVHHSVAKYLPDLAKALDRTGQPGTLHMAFWIFQSETQLQRATPTVLRPYKTPGIVADYERTQHADGDACSDVLRGHPGSPPVRLRLVEALP